MQKIFFIVAVVAIITQSCSHTHEESHQHEETMPKFQITAYNHDFELFAEADAFVKGAPSNILSHFSVLPSFDALETGKVTVSLTIQGNIVTRNLESPTRKGIYSFDITPEITGSGSLTFDIESGELKSRIVISDVKVYESVEDALQDEAGEPSRTNTYVFTKEQSWKIDFATDTVDYETFGQVIKATARVRPAPGDDFLVTAQINGVVSFSSDIVVSGMKSMKNETLFTISGQGLATGNISVQYAEARNNYEKAKSDFERVSALAEDKIVSEKDLLDSKNKYENAKTVFESLERNFSVDGQKVKSPVDGFISQVFVNNGQYVEAGQPLIRIAQNNNLLLYAEVQQKYAPVLSSVIDANIRILPDGNTFSLEELNGRIMSYGRNANADNYLLPVNVLIENKGAFVTGGFAEVYFMTANAIQSVTVPNTSLVEEQGVYFVFVQVHPELFEKREVKPGATDGIRTEIKEGLDLQERIVTNGAIFIKLAQATGTLDAHSGHNH
jgi:membrane fusion protein, heavy metal efflux system